MAYDIGDRVRAQIGTRNAVVMPGTIVGVTDRGYRVRLDSRFNNVEYVVLGPSFLNPLPPSQDRPMAG